MKISKDNLTNRRVTGIKSGRIKTWYDDKDELLQINIKELPPFADFPESRSYSYKFLGYITNRKGESVQIFSIRKRRKQKDKHLTLKWNAVIKTKDVINIKDKEDYKLVTVRLGLPKAAIRNLRNRFNSFLNPKLISIKDNSNTNQLLKIIETERYAFGIMRMLFEKDEIYTEEVMERFNIVKASALKYLTQLEQHDIIVSDSTKHNKRIYMLKIDKDSIRTVVQTTLK